MEFIKDAHYIPTQEDIKTLKSYIQYNKEASSLQELLDITIERTKFLEKMHNTASKKKNPILKDSNNQDFKL